MNSKLKELANNNSEAIQSAAIVTAGNTVIELLTGFISSKVPEQYRSYVHNPIGQILIANIAAQLLKSYKSGNSSLSTFAEGITMGVYQQIFGNIDIVNIFDEFAKNPTNSEALQGLKSLKDFK